MNYTMTSDEMQSYCENLRNAADSSLMCMLLVQFLMNDNCQNGNSNQIELT